jgi:hypothetical protein
MAQQNIHRNLESGQIYIPSFHSGLYTQRNPIFTPLSAMGLQMVSRYDTLWDGLNMELSNASTLQRRPGFPVFCSTPIVSLYGSGGLVDPSVDVFPLTFFSFKNNKGVIRLMMDTNDAVYTFDQNINTPLFQKHTSQQTSFSKVGDWVYMVDGLDHQKWDGSIVPVTTIAEPATAPLFTVLSGQLQPKSGYQYKYAFKNTIGSVGIASLPSLDTGPVSLASQVVIPSNPLSGVETQLPISSNEEYNNPSPMWFLQGDAGAHPRPYDGSDVSHHPGTVVTCYYNDVHERPSADLVLVAAFSSTAGAWVRITDPLLPSQIQGLHKVTAVGADKPYHDSEDTHNWFQFIADGAPASLWKSSSVAYRQVTIADPVTQSSGSGSTNGNSFRLTGDSSPDASVNTIEIYRTEDGKDVYYLLKDIPNPYPALSWSYVDNTLDTTLKASIFQATNSDTGEGLSLMGIATPISKPSSPVFSKGTLFPTVGYEYLYSGKNQYTGHVSTASPVSDSTGSIGSITVTEASIPPAPITSITGLIVPGGFDVFTGKYDGFSPFSTLITVVCVNNLLVGQDFTMSGLTNAASVLNGVSLVALYGTNSTQIVTVWSGNTLVGGFNSTIPQSNAFVSAVVEVPTIPANFSNVLTYYIGQIVIFGGNRYACLKTNTNAGNPPNSNWTLLGVTPTTYSYSVVNAATWVSDGGVKYTVSGVSLALVVGTPATGQYSVANGVYTFAAGDAGKGMSPTYDYTLAAGTVGVSVNISGDSFSDPQVDTIEIYRNDDGGSLYYKLADIPNPYPVAKWTYVDTAPDDVLDTDIVAPIDHSNDPPPPGANLLCYHMGRLWCAFKNFVAFAAGPDCTVGVGEEAWPPANVFAFPGKVTGLVSASAGLLVMTADDMFIIYGTSLVSFYPTVYQKNFGVLSQNCIAQDGDLLFMYTSARQLYMFSGAMSEVGFAISDKFTFGFNPATAILALHRDGPDSGLFISDGSTVMYKYRIDQQAWSPRAQVVGGSGALASIETSPGTYTLLTGQSISGGYSANYILGRNTLVFQDCGVSYPAFAVVGTLVLAPPGTTSILDSVMIERMPVGSDATISIMCNEIAGTFVVLPNPVNDPPLLAPQTSIIAKRHYVRAAQTPVSQQVRHLLVQIAFPAEAVKNELLSLALN